MANETYFKWDDKLRLGVKAMDDEHKKLINLMNDLYILNESKAPFIQIKSKVVDLENYTVNHFKHEEDFFSKIPYKKVESHKAIHKDLLLRLQEHKTQILAQQKIPDVFFVFLKKWLSSHIMGIDTGYALVSKEEVA